ncbi:MAG TPA: PAS domain S-box protein, partial [Methylophilaceae bacterium]|nr:PAS domain S-box protein [Methylophilaceae bacterium]
MLGEPHIRFYAGIPLINPEGIALGSFCLIDSKPRALSEAQIDLLQSLADHVMSLFELRLQRNKLRKSVVERENISRQLNEYTNHLAEAQRIARIGSWELQLEDDQLQWSEQAFRIFGLHNEDAQLSLATFISYVHPEDRSVIEEAHENLMRGGTAVNIEYRFIRPDGQMRYVHALAEPKIELPGEPRKICGTVQDITERKLAELELQRVNRALKMLTASSEALVRGHDEMQLLKEICQLALTIGGYKTAWVGYAHDDAEKSVRMVTYAGNASDAEYLESLNISWSATTLAGMGPAGRAIRSGLPVICEDISQDSMFLWKQQAMAKGYRIAICLPLRDKSHTFGLLVLYGGEARSVPADEVSLLQQMADDLAFGILSIRAREEQQKLQSAVLRVSSSVAVSSGRIFFENLAHSMAEVLGAQGSFIARLLPGRPQRAQTLTAIIDGQVIDNFDYLLEQTPCRNLMQGEDCLVASAAAELYPESPSLAAQNIEAYAGVRLNNASGQPIGMLFALFREPLKHSEFVISTLRIFATRAAAEIERQETDKRISEQASLLDKAQDAIIVRDIEGHIQFWNKSAERLYGWTAEEVLGRRIQSLLQASSDYYQDATKKVLESGEWTGEITQRRKDGSSIVVEGHWTLVRNDKGEPQSILAIKTDITQRKAAEREIQHLAFYDALTGLPNRQLLLDRLSKALAHCARNKLSGALLFIDLDNFKTLNDTLGHDIG